MFGQSPKSINDILCETNLASQNPGVSTHFGFPAAGRLHGQFCPSRSAQMRALEAEAVGHVHA